MPETSQNTMQTSTAPKTIGVLGAGPGIGQAVARRYAREGYTVVLVARRPEPLELLLPWDAGRTCA